MSDFNNPWERFLNGQKDEDTSNDGTPKTARIVMNRADWIESIYNQFIESLGDSVSEETYLKNVTTQIGRYSPPPGTDLQSTTIAEANKRGYVIEVEFPALLCHEEMRGFALLYIAMAFFLSGVMYDTADHPQGHGESEWVGSKDSSLGAVTLEHVDAFMGFLVNFYGEGVLLASEHDTVPLVDKLISLISYDLFTEYVCATATPAMQSDPDAPELKRFLQNHSMLEEAVQHVAHTFGVEAGAEVEEVEFDRRVRTIHRGNATELYDMISVVMCTPVEHLRVSAPLMRQTARQIVENASGYSSTDPTPRIELLADEVRDESEDLAREQCKRVEEAHSGVTTETTDNETSIDRKGDIVNTDKQGSMDADNLKKLYYSASYGTEQENSAQGADSTEQKETTPKEVISLFHSLGEDDREKVLLELSKEFRDKKGLASVEHVMLLQETTDPVPGAVLRYRMKMKDEFSTAGVDIEDSTLDHMAAQYHAMLVQKLV